MKLRNFIVLGFAVLLLGVGNPELGKQKANTCIACHGEDGNSQVDLWPSLAGQNFKYLKRQLLLMKSGERPVLEMAGQLDSFTDQDIEDLAEYYCREKIKIGQVSAVLVDLG